MSHEEQIGDVSVDLNRLRYVKYLCDREPVSSQSYSHFKERMELFESRFFTQEDVDNGVLEPYSEGLFCYEKESTQRLWRAFNSTLDMIGDLTAGRDKKRSLY